jgi:predicted PurR-regulated permease PerM
VVGVDDPGGEVVARLGGDDLAGEQPAAEAAAAMVAVDDEQAQPFAAGHGRGDDAAVFLDHPRRRSSGDAVTEALLLRHRREVVGSIIRVREEVTQGGKVGGRGVTNHGVHLISRRPARSRARNPHCRPRMLRDHERRNDVRTFALKVGLLVVVVLMLALLWAVREVVLLVVIAAAIAAGISPVVRRVRTLWRFRFRRPLNRGAAVMIVYLPFVIGVVLMALLVVPRFVHDSRDLARQLPMLIDRNILEPMGKYVPVNVLREELADGIEVPRARVFGYVRGAATAIASFIAVLFMVAYMLIDAERLRNTFLLIYPPEVRGQRRRTLTRIAKRMSSWLSGQLLLSLIIGGATFVGLLALQIPYALPLAIIAAVGELVPVIGPTIGAVPALGMALLHSRWQFWSVLVFAVLLQKAENLFIVPRVMSRKVSVSPLAIFIAFMMGASLLGVIGAIMAVPLAAVAQVAFEEAFVRRRERRLDSVRAGTLLRRGD